ncbi:hypothetical protein UFOVP241_46 [uncultured Caudovirales phage]|uniref:Uncharacterized protein n=1 Tax=uncultured Caudovirales phage TaxID=2100421 RepID=A0A6J7WT18_9CAUD|nr:hypothetical protein UFOVP241_46 [uncultured Caudovirales phage]
MKTTNTSRAAMLALAALGALAMSPASNGTMRLTTDATATVTNANPQPAHRGGQLPGDTRTNQLDRRSWLRLRVSGRRAGPGWTNAHAKRVARKARNVKRHRAAGRGSK